MNVIFQPLRRNRTQGYNWEPLVAISEKYGKTQNQIILSWLVSRGFLPLVKSENIDHINENIEALSFQLNPQDIELLNNYKIPNYVSPKTDWNRTGDGVAVYNLPNLFDEEYKRQTGI